MLGARARSSGTMEIFTNRGKAERWWRGSEWGGCETGIAEAPGPEVSLKAA